MPEAKKYGKSDWVGAAILAVIFLLGYVWWESGADERAADRKRTEGERESKRAEWRARSVCGRSIASLAAYGKDNDPGVGRGLYENGQWHFSWPHGSFHFKNAFGVEVPQSALCTVDEKTGEIEYLMVSGKEIIKR